MSLTVEALSPISVCPGKGVFLRVVPCCPRTPSGSFCCPRRRILPPSSNFAPLAEILTRPQAFALIADIFPCSQVFASLALLVPRDRRNGPVGRLPRMVGDLI